MLITRNTLPDLFGERDRFVDTFTRYAYDTLAEGGLAPILSKPRLIEARGAWINDLDRVGKHEPNLTEGLDHFKQCGHLAFWLRRMSPLVELSDCDRYGDSPDYPHTTEAAQFRELLFAYSAEYLAFDFGYQIVSYYEQAKSGGSDRAKNLVPGAEFYKIACHFLKYKTVSPHAIHLIYRSMFLP